MADLATLKSRIADEINRTDLTSQIASAISSAIAKYRSRRFEFNEKQDTFSTVNGQESYTSGDAGFPTDIGEIDSVRLTVNGRYVVLEPMVFKDLQALSSTTTGKGQPTRWAWYASKLFFYPIPDAAYSALVSHQQRKAEPSGDADGTTIWTNDAEQLIRHCAKKFIYRDVVKDYQAAKAEESAEEEALTTLVNESVQLQDDGGGISPQW